MNETIAPIGAWKCKFIPCKEIMTDQPTDRPKDMRDHREVTLLKKAKGKKNVKIYMEMIK